MIRTEAVNRRHNLNGSSSVRLYERRGGCMARESFQEKIIAMQRPDERSDVEQIWEIIRSWLVISRIIVLVLMVLLAEFTEEYFLLGVSVSAWCILIGIPLFITISAFIIIGDSSQKQNKEEDMVLMNPILERN